MIIDAMSLSAYTGGHEYGNIHQRRKCIYGRQLTPTDTRLVPGPGDINARIVVTQYKVNSKLHLASHLCYAPDFSGHVLLMLTSHPDERDSDKYDDKH